MKQTVSHYRIKSKADTFWQLLADPDYWIEVNKRITEVRRNNSGPLVLNECFEVDIQSVDDETISTNSVEVTAMTKNSHLYMKNETVELRIDLYQHKSDDWLKITVICQPNLVANLFKLFCMTYAKLVRDGFIKNLDRLALKK